MVLRVDIPVFSVYTYLAINVSKDEMFDYFEKEFDQIPFGRVVENFKYKEIAGKNATMLELNEFNTYIVWFPNFDGEDPECLGNLAHELNHVSICSLNNKGIPISYKNQESICYSLGYLFCEYVKLLNNETMEDKTEVDGGDGHKDK